MAHVSNIIDTDKHFIIDPVTREINTESTKSILIQGDHNSERYTFEMPRFIEGHDMVECDRVEVHYVNVDRKKPKIQSPGVYSVTDLSVDSVDENTLTFSWLVSRNATKHVGSLNFLIRFACVSDNGSVDYEWYTGIFKNISVSDGMNNGEVVEEEYADVLENWRLQIINRLEENTASISALQEATESSVVALQETVESADKYIGDYAYKELAFDLKLSDFQSDSGTFAYITDKDLSFSLFDNNDTYCIIEFLCNEENYWFVSTEFQKHFTVGTLQGDIRLLTLEISESLFYSGHIIGAIVPLFNMITGQPTDAGGTILFMIDGFTWTNPENVSVKIYKVTKNLSKRISDILDEINGEVV